MSSKILGGTAYLDATTPQSTTAYESMKRMLDVVGASAALILAAPLMIAIAVIIKATDSGPIFYVQDRIAQGGRRFRFYKFRSMVVNAEAAKAALLAANAHGDSRTFKMKNDPRITRIGNLIRRASLDELPQLFHVLSGDMSLVGPRPSLPSEVELYQGDDFGRLDVKPGLTCTWQVSGRGDIPFHRQLQMDLAYIRDRSLWKDLKLLFFTVPAIVTGRGAY